MKEIHTSDFLELSVPERLQLVQAIWDSIEPDAVPIGDRERQELDRRLDSYSQNPEAGKPWEEVKARLLRGA